jgi:hypothetical protein
MTDNLEKIKAAQEHVKSSPCLYRSAVRDALDHNDTIQAALAFYARYLELAKTHKLMPIEPSQEMLLAGEQITDFSMMESRVYRPYKAMISAAPDIMKEGA